MVENRRNRGSVRVMLACMVVVGCAVAVESQQPQKAPRANPFDQIAEPKALKVLAKTMTKRQVVDVMKEFSIGLDVDCSYCHLGEEGKPFSAYDFASDEKATKRVAREHLRMVREVNAKYFGEGEMQVTCKTCHAGKAKIVG